MSKRQVLEEWFERVWAQEDSAAIDALFVPDGTAKGLGGEPIVGPEGFKAFHQALCAQLADIVFEIENSMEQGDWISALCTMRATAKCSQKNVIITGNVWIKVSNGLITEAYNHFDFLGLWTQLDLLPSDSFEKCLGGQKAMT